MKMFAVGYISSNEKMYPEPDGKTTWALFVNEGNAAEWSKKHGGKLKIRPVEVSLKFTRPTKRALDGAKAAKK
jgi:hypothetical protein